VRRGVPAAPVLLVLAGHKSCRPSSPDRQACWHQRQLLRTRLPAPRLGVAMQVLEQAHDGIRFSVSYDEDERPPSADAASKMAMPDSDAELVALQAELAEADRSVLLLKDAVADQAAELEDQAHKLRQDASEQAHVAGVDAAVVPSTAARGGAASEKTSRLQELLSDAPTFLERLQEDIRTLQTWQSSERRHAQPRQQSLVPDRSLTEV
jgi:hypothetical protein